MNANMNIGKRSPSLQQGGDCGQTWSSAGYPWSETKLEMVTANCPHSGRSLWYVVKNNESFQLKPQSYN